MVDGGRRAVGIVDLAPIGRLCTCNFLTCNMPREKRTRARPRNNEEDDARHVFAEAVETISWDMHDDMT